MDPTFDQIPKVLRALFLKVERIEHFVCEMQTEQKPAKPKYVDINGAALITSKSPNALRVQISLGNLKSFKKGSRNYFEVEYLEKWLLGETEKEG